MRTLKSIKKNTLLLGTILLFNSAVAQIDCDSIFLGDIRYFPTDANFIEVQAYVNSFDCVSYPSFLLKDENGDTLAVEEVNFFCLSFGDFGTHRLAVHPDANIPIGPFDGTLELFSGFGGSLVCSWDMSLELCPQDSCTQAVIYLTNLETLEAGTIYWQLGDVDNNFYAQGEIEMDLIDHTHFDTVCLPPGDYQLFVSPFSDIWVDEDYILGITHSYNQSNGTNTAQQNDTTYQDLNFNWFEACVEETNSIFESQAPTFTVLLNNGNLEVTATDGHYLHDLQLFDIRGQLMHQETSRTQHARINVGQLPSGVYILRSLDPEFGQYSERVFVGN